MATTAADVTQLLTLLESHEHSTVAEIKELILDNLSSAKESWLVNALVDFYIQTQSQSSLEILVKVTEPHEKQLLDRIGDHLKGSNNKLQGLMLLGHMVRSQPPWMHKIVQHSVLPIVLKIIKTEVDVPILMSAVLLITSLLPLIPVSVVQYLQDIFDGFARLAAFNLKKPDSPPVELEYLGSVPDVYLLHLQVGIYSLFHRLYGMYPCHFLTYLRAVYSKKENAEVFEDTIMPMLERVRMHPLLVTATKDKEISRERWKHLDVHDIVIDCAKLSLDMIEGSKEDVRCPVIGLQRRPHQPVTNRVSQQKLAEFTKILTDSPDVQMPEVIGVEQGSGLKPIVASIDPNSFFSPSALCGMATPPPTPYTTPGGTDMHGTMTTPVRQTQYTPVPESPLTTEVQLRDKGAGSTAQKRLSGLSLSLSGNLPHPTGGGTGSVPPSPLKPDFTTDPPFGAYRMQAIRKIDFQQGQQPQPTSQAPCMKLFPQKTEQSIPPGREQRVKPETTDKDDYTSSQRAVLLRQPTLDQPSPPIPQEQDAVPLGRNVAKTGEQDSEDGRTAKKQLSKVMAKQISLDESKVGGFEIKEEMKRKSWASESKDQGSSRRSWGADGKDSQILEKQPSGESSKEPSRQSSSEDSKAASRHSSGEERHTAVIPAKFEVSKQHTKLSRKPSGKRQRSTESQQVQPPDGEQVQGQNEMFMSPNAKEAPMKIPGKKSDHTEHQSHSVPSVTDLPHFIESLGVSQEDGDDEVSALTGYQIEESSLSSSTCTDPSDLTAESVQQFMKNVNRIRFNSMNMNTRERLERMEKAPKPYRPNSCPDFEKGSEEDVIGEECEEAELALTRKSSGESSTKVKWAPEPQIEMVTTHTVTSSVTISTSSKATIASQTSFASLKDLDPEYSGNMIPLATEENIQTYIPYAHMFPMTLPFAPFMQCYNCVKGSDVSSQGQVKEFGADKSKELESSSDKESVTPRIVGEVPFFSSLSPPELLDRHIQLGTAVHIKQRTHAAQVGKDPVRGITGLASSDEVSVLRGQLLLLHNQLMYERHRREMYAKRNRRLLGRIVKTTALEEQTAAMRDQLVLQENEIHNYSVAAKLQQTAKKQLQTTIDKLEYEKETAHKNFQQELELLKRSNTDLTDQKQRQKADNDKLFKELQNTKSQLFNTKHELESMKLRADFATDLQAQLARLNKELLLMGELQQKYQQRLVSVSSSQNTSAETKFLLESCKEEVRVTKQSLEEKTILYDVTKGKLAELEETLKTKELAITELKKMVENQKELHISQIQALDQKYKNERMIQQALQGQILELTSRLHSMDKPTEPLHKQHCDIDEEGTSQQVEEMM